MKINTYTSEGICNKYAKETLVFYALLVCNIFNIEYIFYNFIDLHFRE